MICLIAVISLKSKIIAFATGGLPLLLGESLFPNWATTLASVIAALAPGLITNDILPPWKVGDTRIDTTILETRTNPDDFLAEPAKGSSQERIIRPDGTIIDLPPVPFEG
jgi:hypothetical protein